MPTIDPEDFFAIYREWQWIKHTIFSDYLWPWANKLGSIAAQIYVVDAFAGAGAYRVGTELREGSPLIEAKRARAYQQKYPGRAMKVICVEASPANCRKLQERLQIYADVATVHCGDFYQHLSAILTEIGTAPAVVLLDPIGLKAITADRCRALIHREGKTDLFVIVHFGIVHRTAGQVLPDSTPDPKIKGAAANVQNVDAFFGSSAWLKIARDAALDKMAKERAYLDLYFRSVLASRYAFKSAYPVRAEMGGAVKYWLVHASNHEDAMWLMNNSIVKVDQLLLRRGHGEQAGEFPGFSTLMADAAIAQQEAEREADLHAEILKQLEAAGGSLPFGKLRWNLVPNYFGQLKEGAYGKAIRELVRHDGLCREQRTAAAFTTDEKIALKRKSQAPDPGHQQLNLF